MDVRVKAMDGFIHGHYNLNRGDEAVMPESLAQDLRHLVEVLDSGFKQQPPHENKMLGGLSNKSAEVEGDNQPGNSQADGEEPMSSASPAAPASAKTTVNKSAVGGKVGKAEK